MSNKSNKLQATAVILALFMALLIIILAIKPTAGEAFAQSESEQPLDLNADALSCRFGATAFGSAQGEKLTELGAGWYLTFGTNPVNTVPSTIEFMPMIRLKQVKSGNTYLNAYTVDPPLTDTGLGAKLAANPRATWIVGNEPDRGPTAGSSGQDDMMPAMYARAYHDVYEFIKARDPEAKVAIAGLVEITPGRLQYLTMVSDAYYQAYHTEIPVDVWTMHLYVMPEVNPNYVPSDLASVAVGTNPLLGMRESRGQAEAHLCGNVNNGVYCFADNDNISFFKRQITDMRSWMKAHGQQYKPLLITEYSILYAYETFPDGSCDFLRDEFGQCFTPVRISNYLRKTFDLINGPGELKDPNLGYPQDDYRLVQQVLWYSLYTTGVGPASNLYSDADLTTMTAIGTAFKEETAERSPVPNLLAWNAASGAGFIVAPATTATVTVSVDVYNNGDTAVSAPVEVTFYADQAMANIIGSALLPDLNGCARGAVTVSVPWSGLTAGVHRYWVMVDSGNVLVEGSESDNAASGVVIIDPEQTFLPLVLRK